MKRYIYLCVISFITFGAVAYFYFLSKSGSTEEHYKFTNTIKALKQYETNIEKDILNSRSFLSTNYDTVVTDTEAIVEHCHSLLQQKNFLSTDVVRIANQYCALVDNKIDDIERFKSKNAILKNSLFYMQKVATESPLNAANFKISGNEYIMSRQLLRVALAYYMLPTKESLEAFNAVMKMTAVFKGDFMVSMRLHANNILMNKSILDEYVKSLVTENKSRITLDELSETYTHEYKKAESSASIYRNLLFFSSIGLLVCIIYSVFALWQAGLKLKDANENLEFRVQQRTKELKESQDIIVMQQQSLISSAKMSALGEMAGGVAHEINNPLAVISLRADQLRDCIEETPIDKEMFLKALDAINKTTDRIAKIVTGLRFFARDGSSMPFVQSPVAPLIEDTLSFCSEKFNKCGVTVNCDLSTAKNYSLDCRPIEISQVILNLLNNSFDAIQELPEKWIKIEFEDYDSKHIAISVTDSGKGIDTAIQERIMQPFFTTKELGKGTGLGLSISTGIVQTHNGKLYIDNNCENTRFVMLLPKVQNAELEKAV